MKLFKKTILAGVFTALLPVASFTQITESQSATDPQAELVAYWAENNEEALREEFEDSSLSWGAYLLSLGHEAEESTNYSALFHAFEADFTRTHNGLKPQQASLGQLREYYAKRKNSYGGELLLPTIAIWQNRPMSSIVPLPDRLDQYWGNPNQAGDTYDVMASIDPEDTLYFMGSYLGSFYGHPTKQKVLKDFWKKWIKRSDNSAAKRDIVALKRAMLSEILSHDPQYAIYELASKDLDLWPQLYVSPVTVEEQNRVQEIISSYCLEDDPTENCARFVNYANRYKYTNNIAKEIRSRLSVIYYGGNWGFGIYDDLYYDSWLYHRSWRPDPLLVWYWDIWHPYYYWVGRYYNPFDYRWYAYPWFWHRPPVIVGHPGGHRPPAVNHGHRPPSARPGGHHPGGPGRPSAGGHRPGNRPPDAHGGNSGNRPHGRPDSHGNNTGRGHGNGGGRPGHSGNGGHPSNVDNGNQPGRPGGNGGHPSNVDNGNQPGRPGGNGGHPSNADNGNQPGRPGGNGGQSGNNNGTVRPGRGVGATVRPNTSGTTVRRSDMDRPSVTTRQIETTKVNRGNTDRVSNSKSSTPSVDRSTNGRSGHSGSSTRPSSGTSVAPRSSGSPTRSSSAASGNMRSGSSISTRPSASSFGGSNHSSGGSFGGSSRSSGSGSLGGSSRSSGGGFSGRSHGGGHRR